MEKDIQFINNEWRYVKRSVNLNNFTISYTQKGGFASKKEAIKALQGDWPEDLKEVVLELGANMLVLAKKAKTIEEAKDILEQNIKNGKAYNKFVELVKNQGGDTSYILEPDNFEEAKYVESIYSNEDGYISKINAKEIGKLACYLGAGRVKKDDEIDKAVGIVLKKKVGDKVKKDDILAYIHANELKKLREVKESLIETIKIGREKIKNPSVI